MRKIDRLDGAIIALNRAVEYLEEMRLKHGRTFTMQYPTIKLWLEKRIVIYKDMKINELEKIKTVVKK